MDSLLSRDAGAGAEFDLFSGGRETIDQFLALYPGITRQQVVAVLDFANHQILECASLLTSA